MQNEIQSLIRSRDLDSLLEIDYKSCCANKPILDEMEYFLRSEVKFNNEVENTLFLIEYIKEDDIFLPSRGCFSKKVFFT